MSTKSKTKVEPFSEEAREAWEAALAEYERQREIFIQEVFEAEAAYRGLTLEQLRENMTQERQKTERIARAERFEEAQSRYEMIYGHEWIAKMRREQSAGIAELAAWRSGEKDFAYSASIDVLYANYLMLIILDENGIC